MDVKAMERLVSGFRDQELEMVERARLAGIQIMPHMAVQRPTLLVSQETYDAFCAKYAPEKKEGQTDGR